MIIIGIGTEQISSHHQDFVHRKHEVMKRSQSNGSPTNHSPSHIPGLISSTPFQHPNPSKNNNRQG
jgi:hypothetical protein